MADVQVKTTRDFDGGNATSTFTGTPALSGGSSSTANTSYAGVSADGGSSNG
jgi:hypothetical protein